jgi:putative membrane protein
MRRATVRWALAGLLVVLAVAFPAAGLAVASQMSGAEGPRKVTYSNVIDGRDAEFLTVIRFANLWEMPMGKLATERGTTKEVKTAGSVMLNDHTKLNTLVEQLAKKFGVQIPDKPKSSHQGWMAEISGKQGVDFDKTFATRLRAAHGSVFSTIAEVRAGTHNKTILDFATQANAIVLKHMSAVGDWHMCDVSSGRSHSLVRGPPVGPVVGCPWRQEDFCFGGIRDRRGGGLGRMRGVGGGLAARVVGFRGVRGC